MNPTGESSGTLRRSSDPEDLRVLELKVKLDHKKKVFSFSFSGEWRGRDVKYVTNHAFREYQKYMKGVRNVQKPLPEPAKPEPKEATSPEVRVGLDVPSEEPRSLTFTLPDEEPVKGKQRRARKKASTEDN